MASNVKAGNITFHKVEVNDYKFLYEILKQRSRTGDNINSSMLTLPSYEQHINWLSNNPYKIHAIVKYGDISYGTVYIDKKDEIGIYTLTTQIRKIIKNYGRPNKLGFNTFTGFIEKYTPDKFNGKVSILNTHAVIMDSELFTEWVWVRSHYHKTTWADKEFVYYECTKK